MHSIRRSTIRRDLELFLPSFVVIAAMVVSGITLFISSEQVMAGKIREELRTAAALGAMQFNPQDITAVQTTADAKKPAYTHIVNTLRAIRSAVPNARFAYIFRRTSNPNELAFVADADAFSSLQELDFNGNGRVDENEVAGQPGELYDITGQSELHDIAFLEPTVSAPYSDQWGPLISGFSPIFDARGKVIAIIGIDLDAQEFISLSQSAFSPWILLLILLLGSTMAWGLGYIALRRRGVMQKKIEKERSALVSLAMHQIGAPLASIRWWKELLNDGEPVPLPTERADAYAQLSEGVDRVSDIVEALRKAAEFSAAEANYQPKRESLYDLVDEAIRRMEPEAKKKLQKIVLDMEETMNVSLDHKLMLGVLTELLGNALSFSPENTEVAVRVTRNGKNAIVSVQDHGCGIPTKELMDIFGEFHRASNASKFKPVGNGLGLYTSKRIVELAGGFMSIESTEGTGTTVSFMLPIA